MNQFKVRAVQALAVMNPTSAQLPKLVERVGLLSSLANDIDELNKALGAKRREFFKVQYNLFKQIESDERDHDYMQEVEAAAQVKRDSLREAGY